MRNLVVLSEIDCRKFLNSINIFPDEFYTDFTMFKNRTSSFHESEIVIIFAGSCRFSKRHILETIKVIKKRADSDIDNGVLSLTVFTDVILPSLSCYYKFQGSPFNIARYSGWKLREKNSNIWGTIFKGSEHCKDVDYLTNFDTGDISEMREKYSSATSPDEEYRRLIIKPDFTAI